jgi:hypothetical protein
MAKHCFILRQMSKCTLKEKPKILASENWKVVEVPDWQIIKKVRSTYLDLIH